MIGECEKIGAIIFYSIIIFIIVTVGIYAKCNGWW